MEEAGEEEEEEGCRGSRAWRHRIELKSLLRPVLGRRREEEEEEGEGEEEGEEELLWRAGGRKGREPRKWGGGGFLLCGTLVLRVRRR